MLSEVFIFLSKNFLSPHSDLFSGFFSFFSHGHLIFKVFGNYGVSPACAWPASVAATAFILVQGIITLLKP